MSRAVFVATRIYRPSHTILKEAMTATVPAEGESLAVQFVTDAETSGVAYIEPGTGNEERIEYEDVDEVNDLLLDITRPDPLIHALDTEVVFGDDPEPEMLSDGFLEGSSEKSTGIPIEQQLWPYFEVGDANEYTVEVDVDELGEVLRVATAPLDIEPVIDGAYVAPGTVSSTDGIPPASSPTPTVRGGLVFLLAEWTAIANADPVTYEVHISTTTGFTPDATTKKGEITGTFMFIKAMPDGSALSYGTMYYVKTIAKDADGSAAASAQESGQLVQAAMTDFASGIRPPRVVGALPANPYTGFLEDDLVVLTTDHKLYRLVDDAAPGTTGWSRAVDGVDITADSIVAVSIAAGAIGADELAANAVTAVKIAANAIVTDKIDALAITSAKIAADAITADKIEATAIDGKTITGALIRTAASGTRLEITGGLTDRVSFYFSGDDEPGVVRVDATRQLVITPPHDTTDVFPTVHWQAAASGGVGVLALDGGGGGQAKAAFGTMGIALPSKAAVPFAAAKDLAFEVATGFNLPCWHDGSGTEYPVEQGKAITATVATSQTTTSTTYADLTTTGPDAVCVAPASGMILVIFAAQAGNSAGNFTSVSVLQVGSGDTDATLDAYRIMSGVSPAQRFSSFRVFIGLTPGTSYTFRMKYRVSAGTGTFVDRRVTAIPV